MKSSGRAGPPSGRGSAGARAAAREDSERGGITLMLVVLFVGLLAMVGIVIDGGAKLTEAENAASAAQEAARAGAGIVNQARAYSGGSFTVQRTQALDAARKYIATAGYQGTASPLGANSIQVTVTVTEPTRVLSIIGIDSITSTGTATAQLVTGVTGPGT
jgi:Flp pilus assembly protein TadG